MSDSDDLYRLLSDPVVPEEHPRRWRSWVLAASLLVVLTLTYLVLGDEAEQSDVATATPVDATLPAGAVSSTDSVPTTLPPFEHPEARINASMVRDPTTDEIVLLGGREGSRSEPVTGVWLMHSDRTWTPVEATLEPTARELAPMVYADSVERVLVFGGSPDPTFGCGLHTFIGAAAVDVWSFDTSRRSWDRVLSSSGPDDRWGHAVAHVPGLGTVLFGGASTRMQRDFATLLDDTWLFDPTTGQWQRLDTEVGPPGRACHGMVYDPGTGLVFLWGGQIAPSSGDTSLWTFDPDSLRWSEVPIDDGPGPRWMHEMVYEPETMTIHVIGGIERHSEQTDSGSTMTLRPTDEVWALDTSSMEWSERASLPGPFSGHATALAGDGEIVVLDGVVTLVYDAVWETWTDITPYELLQTEE